LQLNKLVEQLNQRAEERDGDRERISKFTASLISPFCQTPPYTQKIMNEILINFLQRS
jgi:hypothetical protein